MSVQFSDYSLQVIAALNQKAENFLEEAASEVQSETQRNTPVDTGQLKGSFSHAVDRAKLEATVGSPLERAIYTEFGTGEYAFGGLGRRGGWRYKDAKGNWHFTLGQKPVRMLFNAFATKKAAIINRAKQIFGELGK